MKNRKNRPVNGKVFRSGVYSTAILAAAILLAVLVNLVVRAIPSKYTEFDLSEGKMYTLGDSSVQLAQSLQQDVTIYFCARRAAKMPSSRSCWTITPPKAAISIGSRRTRPFTPPLRRSTGPKMHPPEA